MKDNPDDPGAHAMILEWRDEQNDVIGHEEEYYRIKIFTREGMKYADVEIPYLKNADHIHGVMARTTHPDGSVLDFEGKIYEKLVVKAHGVKFLAKTFSCPDVRPGDVIEYRYAKDWDRRFIHSSRWELQKDLFMKKGILKLRPAGGMWYSNLITVGVAKDKLPVWKDNTYLLELNNVPAYDDESYSLPSSELIPRIDFFYSRNDLADADKFWADYEKSVGAYVEKYIGDRGAIRKAAQTIVAPADPPETKLRKIYQRVHQLRNLSFERSTTEQEQKREKLKDNNDVEDVWSRGYGYANELNRLYVALVRAAGLSARVVRVSRRDQAFFAKALLDYSQMDGELTLANIDGKVYLLAPGNPYCPFGMLSWERTGVTGIPLEQDGGGEFFTTPAAVSTDATVQRKATLHLDNGVLKGQVLVSYTGQDALVERLTARDKDDTEEKNDLENALKSRLPPGSKARLISISGLEDPEKPIAMRYEIEVPGFGSRVGARLILPLEILQSQSVSPFRHEKRKTPVYFDYPFEDSDEITLDLPPGYHVEKLPEAQKHDSAIGSYQDEYKTAGDKLVLTRKQTIKSIIVPVEYYPNLREFYEQVNTGDQQAVVLREQPATTGQ